MREILFDVFLVVISSAGCGNRNVATQPSATMPAESVVNNLVTSLVMQGGFRFEKGQWIDGLHIENHGRNYLVVSESFSADYRYQSPMGIGSLHWMSEERCSRYVFLKPASSSGLSDYLHVDVPLDSALFHDRNVRAKITMELHGQALSVEANNIVQKDFVIQIEQKLGS